MQTVSRFLILNVILLLVSTKSMAQSLVLPKYTPMPVKPRVTRQTVDGYAAIVQGRIITYGDVLEKTAYPRQMAMRQFRNDRKTLMKELEGIYSEGLDKLIEDALILAEFESSGGTIPDAAVQDNADDFIRKNYDGNRAKFIKHLQASGRSEADWRESIRDQMAVGYMTQQNIMRNVAIGPRDIRDYYQANKSAFIAEEEIHLFVISFRPQSAAALGPDPTAKKIAAVQEKLAAGESFTAIAVALSEDPTAAKGGDSGWWKRSALHADLRQGIEGLKTGEVSKPVKMSSGHTYFLRIADTRGGVALPLSEVEQDIRRILRNQTYERYYQRWIEVLRRKYSVERFDLRQLDAPGSAAGSGKIGG